MALSQGVSNTENGLTYYHFSLFISSGGVLFSLVGAIVLYIIRFIMQLTLEERHSVVSDKSATLYDIYESKKQVSSYVIILTINVIYWLENLCVMAFVWSAVSYFGAASAFGKVHWAISFSVSVLITIAMSLHTFRHRNIHKQLRRKDFIEHEAANALYIANHKTHAELTQEINLDDDGEPNAPFFQNNNGPAQPDIELEDANKPQSKQEEYQHVPNTPIGDLNPANEYVYKEFTREELGVVRYVLFHLFTEIEIYFRSIEMGLKRYRLFLFVIFLFFNVLVTTFVVSFFYGTCICQAPYDFSTSFMRYVRGDPCGQRQLCGLVLNLPEDPSTTMVVKFYSQSTPESSSVDYGVIPGDMYDNRANCTVRDLNSKKSELTKRYIHTCYLTGLNPDTVYYFQANYITLVNANSTNLRNSTTREGRVPYQVSSDVRSFRTLHDTNADVVWVNLGEMGISTRAEVLLQIASQYDPHFFAFTGNMAFDSGLSSCTGRWVQFLMQYDKYVRSSEDHMIPILTAVGNFEAEFHQVSVTREEIQPYLQIFAHSVANVDTSQPTYHVHKLGTHSSLTVLDSGISQTHASQVDFMQTKWGSAALAATRKFVMYNIPLYPSVSSFSYAPSVNGRNSWESVFNSYGVLAAFEGHDRTLKRTRRIVNGVISNSAGVVYLGDGSAGVMQTNKPATRSYIAVAQDVPHFWLVRASETQTVLQAIDRNGDVLDSTTV